MSAMLAESFETATVHVTIEVTVPAAGAREAARRLAEGAGLRVLRATVKRDPVTTERPDVRASADLDVPRGLSDLERWSYVRGYARGCLVYARKYGTPTMTGDVDRAELHAVTVRHEWDRHPSAHKAGLAELNRWQTKYGSAA